MLGVWGRLREFPYRFFHMIRSMLKISIERTRIHELPIAVTLDVDDKGAFRNIL